MLLRVCIVVKGFTAIQGPGKCPKVRHTTLTPANLGYSTVPSGGVNLTDRRREKRKRKRDEKSKKGIQFTITIYDNDNDNDNDFRKAHAIYTYEVTYEKNKKSSEQN
jgi:hypothetical protein